MKVQVITLFPKMLEGFVSESILGAAQEKGILEVSLVDLRNFCKNKHRTADDAPYGGGGGMVLKAEPIKSAIEACKLASPQASVIYLSPQGEKFRQPLVMELSKLPDLILLCGRYEGIDQRVLDKLVDREVSIGDYVLTGGELPAAVLIDAVARQLPGVLGDENSAANDSFYKGLLDFPHYTRPVEWEGLGVPEVLLSGDHQKINQWRRQQALRATFFKRSDLLDKVSLSEGDEQFLYTLGWKKAFIHH